MDNTTKKMAENLHENGKQSDLGVELSSELAMNSFDNQILEPRRNTDIVHKINSILRSGSGLHRHS